MKVLIGHRFQPFAVAASLELSDALLVNCFWPKLDRPTRIFTPGSTGIKVMGSTPRNVWFPDDVEFVSYYPDALYPAERAVFEQFQYRRGLINLSVQEAQVWWDAYNKAADQKRHVLIETRRDVNFLRHRELVSEREAVLKEDSVSGDTVLKAGAVIVKRGYEEFVAELTPEECVALVDGKADELDLRASKEFRHISEVKRTRDGAKSPLTLAEWKAAR